MTGTLGKVGGEIRIGKRRAESETDCSSHLRGRNHVKTTGEPLPHGRQSNGNGLRCKSKLAMCLSHRPNSMNLI